MLFFLLISGFLSSQGASPQVLSAFVGLTAVFGMGTGGSLQPSPLNYLFRISYPDNCIKSIFLNVPIIPASLLKSSPRSISTGPLHTSLCFHSRPIYHVVFMGPYLLPMRNLIFRLVSRLDAFSVYPSRT